MFNYKLNYFILLTFIGSLLGCHDKASPTEQVNQHHQSPDVVDQRHKVPENDFSHFPNRTEYTNLGFKNLGNTCFANAVFKLLSANPEFLEFLNSKNDSSETNIPSKSGEKKKKNRKNKRNRKDTLDRKKRKIKKSLNTLFTRYKSLERLELDHPKSENTTQSYTKELTSFYNRLNSYFKEVYGGGVYAYFRLKENGFIPGNQQDAHEFILEILETLNYTSGFSLTRRSESSDGTRMNTPQTDPLFSFELSIDSLSESEPKINSLAEALARYLDDVSLPPNEGVDAEDGLEKLTENKQKISVTNLDQIPSYFFAQMKRYSYNRQNGKTRRLNHEVDSKTPIQMQIFEENSAWDENARIMNIFYEPIGFVVHLGDSPWAGHYYSYIYDNQSNSWYKHDDSRVTKLTDPEEMKEAWNDINQNGYIVLYREIQRAPAY